MGVCVAIGKPWIEFKTNQTTVLIIDEESGERRLARRLGDAMRGHNAHDDLPLAYVSLAGINLKAGSPDIETLQGLIEQTKAGFVIIDALADVMLGSDENSVKDVQPVFFALRQIAEATQTAFLVIHHSNKAGGYRGSTALKGAVDLMLMVESKADSSLIGFSMEKARDEMIQPFAATAHFELGQFYLTETEPEKKQKHLSNSKSYVLRYLTQHGQASVEEIKSHADSCSAVAARQAIYALVNDGEIERADDGGRGQEAIYRLKIQPV